MDQNLQRLQDQSLKMQDMLKNEEVVAESGSIKIVMRGDQFVKNVYVNDKDNIELAGAFNEVIKKSQDLAARKLLELQNS